VDTGARDRGGRGFGSWFKPRKTGSFPRGTETSRKAFFLVKKKQIVYGISVCVSLHFFLSVTNRKSPPDARTTARETETSHDATRTAPSLFSFVFVIGVFREDT
jgi:hypothetical protein